MSRRLLLFTVACWALHGADTVANELRWQWKPGQQAAYFFDVQSGLLDKYQRMTGVCVYEAGRQVAARSEESSATGTAFVVHADGWLVTCEHVVRGAKQVQIKLGEQTLIAEIKAVDRGHDLALLKVPGRNLPVLPLGKSKDVQLAEEVRVVGFPLASVLGSSIKVTRGSVSGFVERQPDGSYLQVDAAINPGNSGGPVVNERGEVVGVASAKIAGAEISNVGFATPVDVLSSFLRQHRVTSAAATNPQKLEGPELARRVTPGVAFVNVQPADNAVRHEIKFRGKVAMTLRRGGSSFTQIKDVDAPGLVVDTQGVAHNSSGRTQLPHFLGPMELVGFELLPDAATDKQWESEGITLLIRPNRFVLATERIPAREATRYEIKETKKHLVTIRKRHELNTLLDRNAGSSIQMSGSGEFVFDTQAGRVESLQMTYEVKYTIDGVEEQIPVIFEFHRIEPARAFETKLDAYPSQLKLPQPPSAKPPVPVTPPVTPPKPDAPVVSRQPIKAGEPLPPGLDLGYQRHPRDPLPDKAAREQGARYVTTKYAKQLAAAKSPRDKLVLAIELLFEGKFDSATENRFAIYDKVRQLAIEGGEASLACEALCRLRDHFQYDSTKLEWQTANALVDGAKTENQHRIVAEIALQVARDAIDKQNFELAGPAGSLALKQARLSGEESLTKRVDLVAATFVQRKQEFDKLQAARDTLKQRPDDPDANLLLGSHFCLVQRDWATGLPLLAKGSHAGYRAAARQEMDGLERKSAVERVVVADRWWELAEAADDERTKRNLKLHAQWHYKRVFVFLPGPEQAQAFQRTNTRVAERSGEIDAEKSFVPADVAATVLSPPTARPTAPAISPPVSLPQPTPPRPTPPVPPVFPSHQPPATLVALPPADADGWHDLLSIIDIKRDNTGGSWEREGQELHMKRPGFLSRIAVPYKPSGSYEVEIEFNRREGNECIGVVLPVGDTACMLVVAGFSGKRNGFTLIERMRVDDPRNPSVREAVLENDKRHKLRIQVRLKDANAELDVKLDDRPHVHWEGPQASISEEVFWKLRGGISLGLAADRCVAVFHRARYRPLRD